MPKKSKLTDPDNPTITAAQFAKAKRFHELPVAMQKALKRARGPQKTPTKERVSIMLSRDVTEALRATGPGWQARVDGALRAWVQLGEKVA